MATALNLTLPLKQDEETQQQLAAIQASFAETLQSVIEAALQKSEIVHFARFIVVDNKYLQVLTEFDGDVFQYTEFFRQELQDVFKLVFSLVEGAPSWDEVNNPNAFFELIDRLNLHSFGSGQEGRGYLFSAYGDMTVREIQAKLSQ